MFLNDAVTGRTRRRRWKARVAETAKAALEEYLAPLSGKQG
jgi:hypothetical protein